MFVVLSRAIDSPGRWWCWMEAFVCGIPEDERKVGWRFRVGAGDDDVMRCWWTATAQRGGPFHRAHRRCAVAAELRIARLRCWWREMPEQVRHDEDVADSNVPGIAETNVPAVAE